jgi:hypothetical protein
MVAMIADTLGSLNMPLNKMMVISRKSLVLYARRCVIGQKSAQSHHGPGCVYSEKGIKDSWP